MKISILKSDTFKTINWSGGTTTEIYIYPKDANYQKRNFNFRLSKAVVTDKNSIFTPLPEVQRKLMVLEGCITLAHENQHTKQLSNLDVDTFYGGWRTSCKGNCTDFNLMMMGNTSGNLEGFQIQKNQAIERDVPTGLEFVFDYNFGGKTNITVADEAHCIDEGDLMIIERPESRRIRISAFKNSNLVWVNITTKSGINNSA